MKWITNRPRTTALLSLFLVAFVLSALAPDTVLSQGRYIYSSVLKGTLRVGDNSSIQPSNDGKGSLGTSAKAFNYANLDSAVIDTSINLTRQLGTILGGPNGATLMKVMNESGSSISAGDALVWDNSTITVTTPGDIAASDASCTVAQDLTTESAGGGYFSLVGVAAGTVDADTLDIYGLDEDGESQNIRFALTDGATTTSMVINGSTLLYWTDVDSISLGAADGLDSLNVVAYPYSGVLAADGANTDFAGVAWQTIADNAIGYAAIHGPVDATVDAASNAASPGVMLELASGGDMVVDTGATTGKNVARAMEYSNKDNQKMRVLLDSY